MIMLQKRAQTLGWLLFIASALFFCFASLKAGDMIALTGSLLFLFACFFFLLPAETTANVENSDRSL